MGPFLARSSPLPKVSNGIPVLQGLQILLTTRHRVQKGTTLHPPKERNEPSDPEDQNELSGNVKQKFFPRISDSTCAYHSTFFLGEQIENSTVSTFVLTRLVERVKAPD
uniref:Orf108b n=1 Tax=Batis maritima TaxID=4436 RepID=A0A068BFD6_BATMA|nr:orf108b [Batis maritima]AIC83414.1 orf108b [Batis maritima]